MKVAIFGHTLYAGVMSALLSESGHFVYWCPHFNEKTDRRQYSFQDETVSHLLDQQSAKGFLNFCHFEEVPLEIDVYLFSFHQEQEKLVFQLLHALKQRPIIHPKLMINASTLGLKKTEQFQQVLFEDDWVYLPDTIQEGNALRSLTKAKQLIVGCSDVQAQSKIKEFLRPLFPLEQQFLFMPILDAEFTKLSISGMLATRISYINDLAIVAEKLGIDIAFVRQGMAADNRIGSAYLAPSAGFGGENFSHDVLTLANTVAHTGVKSQLLAQVWEINEQQKEILFRKLWNYYHGDLQGKTVAIWGASFKENTASIQQSAIHPMLAALWAQGVTVRLHDPQALNEIKAYYGQRDDLILCDDQYQAVQGVAALCVLTAWKQYWSPDFKALQQYMSHPLILDGRNIYNPSYVKAQGFAYMGVGH